MRLFAILTLAFAGHAFAQTPAATPASAEPAVAAPPTRVMLLTTEGEIVLELDAVKAPKTVENFLMYVKSGHYSGTIFHRVMPNFMIQGGGYNSALQYKPTKPPVQNEASNGLLNNRGTLAMARTNDPHSASAQFFINLVNNGFLNYQGPANMGYTVFGKVVSGMEVVDKIAAKPTSRMSAEFANLPDDYIVIQKAEILPPAAAPAQ